MYFILRLSSGNILPPPFFFPLHGSTIHHYSTVISICKYQRAMKTNSSFLCCWVSSCLVQNLNNKLRNKSPWPAQSFSSCAEYIQHSSHATSESASLPFPINASKLHHECSIGLAVICCMELAFHLDMTCSVMIWPMTIMFFFSFFYRTNAALSEQDGWLCMITECIVSQWCNTWCCSHYVTIYEVLHYHHHHHNYHDSDRTQCVWQAALLGGL